MGINEMPPSGDPGPSGPRLCVFLCLAVQHGCEFSLMTAKEYASCRGQVQRGQGMHALLPIRIVTLKLLGLLFFKEGFFKQTKKWNSSRSLSWAQHTAGGKENSEEGEKPEQRGA